MTLYGEALGYRSPSGSVQIPAAGQSAAAGKRLLTAGYSPEAIIGCYHWLKSQPFWTGKLVTLTEVEKQIGEWVRLGKPERAGTTKKTPQDTVTALRAQLGWDTEP